jgi:DNA polymerase-3 subunit gamma/tau
MCSAINQGSALDIIEIDAASNRGIDEIRDLKEKVNYTPSFARYKVYIIDEVHMITKEAANAFLKTLEEPPAHAIFILATTEPHKVLPTVLSRCQRFDFRRLSQTAVISKLELISNKEEIQIKPDSLRLIAKVTTGSLRDAENLLEQLVSYYGHEIELHQVQAMLGISGDQRVKDLTKHIINKDISEGLKTINSVANDGLDLRQFNREFVTYLRELLLVKSGSEEIVDVTSDDLNELKSLIDSVDLYYLFNAIKLFGEAELRLDNYSPLPLELALIDSILLVKEKAPDYSEPSTTQKTAEKKQVIEKESNDSKKSKDVKQETQPQMSKPITATEEQKSDDSNSEQSQDIADEVNSASQSTSSHDKSDASAAIETTETTDIESLPEIDDVRTRWRDFINTMRGEGSAGNLDARLRSACEPVDIDNDSLVLGFYHDFHKNYIDDPKYRFLVEKKLKEFFGKTYKLRCIVIERKKETAKKPETESRLVQAALERGAKKIDVQ